MSDVIKNGTPTGIAVRLARRRLAASIGGVLLASQLRPGSAQANDYPSRPIRIVPFGAAGGPIDAIARSFGERLTQRWNQPVLIDPKPGASGIIAVDFVAKAPPDGYTILLTLSLTHINNAIIQSKLPYDPVNDFQPLTQIGTGGPMLIVPSTSPVSNMKEFIAWGKARDRVTYGTWGNGSTAHLFGELIKRNAGVPMDHIAYKAEAAAHVDMFGGLLDCAWANPATARTHIRAGKAKVLGIAGSRRVGTIPEVATFAEQGLDGFSLDSWVGFYAPARVPQAVLDKLVEALREITRTPEVSGRLLDMGFEPRGNTPAEFVASVRGDYSRWEAIIKAAGVTAQ